MPPQTRFAAQRIDATVTEVAAARTGSEDSPTSAAERAHGDPTPVDVSAATVFVEAGGTIGEGVDAQAALQRAWAHSATHWGDPLEVTLVTLAAHLGRHRVSLGDDLAELRLHELHLCSACAAGSAAAHRILERDYCRPVAERVFSGLDAGLADELRQALREKLLLRREAREPKIAKYSGRGRLLNWIRVLASRLRIDRVSPRPLPPAHPLTDPIAPGRDAEQDLLKARCKQAFSAAFGGAIESLSMRQRNVLRQRLLFGTTLAATAELYAVNVRTVKRWLADARRTLRDNTRAHLEQMANLHPGEFDSIVRILDSEMDLSIARMLHRGPDSAPPP